MQVVNGKPCFNCTDVENAKKAPQLQQQDPLKLDLSKNLSASNVAAAFQTANAPLAQGDRGRVLNFGA